MVCHGLTITLPEPIGDLLQSGAMGLRIDKGFIGCFLLTLGKRIVTMAFLGGCHGVISATLMA